MIKIVPKEDFIRLEKFNNTITQLLILLSLRQSMNGLSNKLNMTIIV